MKRKRYLHGIGNQGAVLNSHEWSKKWWKVLRRKTGGYNECRNALSAGIKYGVISDTVTNNSEGKKGVSN